MAPELCTQVTAVNQIFDLWLEFPGVELQNKQALGSLPRKSFYTNHTFSENVSYPFNTFRLIFQPTAAPL